MGFIAYDVATQMIHSIAPVIAQVRRHDKALADQMRRAASSVPLNIQEGSHSRGGNRAARYQDAAGSAAEVRAALQVAIAWGYVTADSCQEADALLDRCLALLWRLTRPKSAAARVPKHGSEVLNR